jgi:hypothetical protein
MKQFEPNVMKVISGAIKKTLRGGKNILHNDMKNKMERYQNHK